MGEILKDHPIDIETFEESSYKIEFPEVYDPNDGDTYQIDVTGLEKTFMSAS